MSKPKPKQMSWWQSQHQSLTKKEIRARYPYLDEYPRDDGSSRHWGWKKTHVCQDDECAYTAGRRSGDLVKCPHHGETMKEMPWKFKLAKASKRGKGDKT